MNAPIGIDKCLTFINCQLQPADTRKAVAKGGLKYQSLTISRQAGSGAHTIGEHISAVLQSRFPKDPVPWTVFDRNLVEKVLEEHSLPKSLARFMPEDRISEVSDTMDELFGLHPPSWDLVHKTSETILHLAQLGHVIIIGRGANVITAKLDGVLHVRLVGSEEKRVDRATEFYELSKRAARNFIQREDRGRVRFMRKYFDVNIDDPLLYHLIINTDRIDGDDATKLIVDAMVGA
jgi:cytidylate kinase